MQLTTTGKKILGDIYTPVGIYLRLRDRFRDTILLESTDHHANENSYSFICINAIGGIEVKDNNALEFKLPGNEAVKMALDKQLNIPQYLWDFMKKFEVEKPVDPQYQFAQGLYGYTCFDAISFFDKVPARKKQSI